MWLQFVPSVVKSMGVMYINTLVQGDWSWFYENVSPVLSRNWDKWHSFRTPSISCERRGESRAIDNVDFIKSLRTDTESAV